MLRTLLSKRSALALVAALPLAGCPDPKGAMNAFVDRSPIQDAAVDLAIADTGGVSNLQVEGLYLFSFSTFLRPDYPILFGATITFEPAATPTAADAGTLTLILQPLYCKNENGATPNCTRELAGGPLDPFVFKVGEDGRFDADLGGVTVPGDANPVSGRDIVATLVLHGFTRDHEICGGVTGAVSAPIQAPLEVADNRFGTIFLGEVGATVDYKKDAPRYDCSAAGATGADSGM